MADRKLGEAGVLHNPWGTHAEYRAVFCFEHLLQMSITDAYLALKLELNREDAVPAFPDFLSRLAYQLIHNNFDEVEFRSPPPANRRVHGGAHVVSPVVRKSHEEHALLNLVLLSPFSGKNLK
jgi:hypothetical protein